MRLVISKNYIGIDEPLIFLAGPIVGASNWQDEAVEIIFSLNPNLIIASPKWGIRESIAKYIVNGDENYFRRARAWERHYIEIASKNGAIMFWLPGEEKHDCNKVYGAMTRIELGQWLTRYSLDNKVRFCIGSDGKFSELRTIEFDFKTDAPDKVMFNSLEETCREAVRLAGL